MKFGVREICNVTFKTTAKGQKVGTKVFRSAGMPAFHIDTAKTSTLEQASTTVYAQGGRGNNRLIAWEGEKTMTFTVEDALISPQGLGVLTGAGLIKADKDAIVHVHMTRDISVRKGIGYITLSDLQEETYLNDEKVFFICNSKDDVPVYGTKLDGSGAGVEYLSDIDIIGDTEYKDIPTNTIAVSQGHDLEVHIMKENPDDTKKTILDDQFEGTVKVDFYIVRNSGASQIVIEPDDFGGYFYVEADTLFRREDSGKDMAATITLPKVKVQSAFTFTMASSGDPSTFTFTMDAFPGYTNFDKTKKVICTMEVLGADGDDKDESGEHPIHSI